MEQPIVVVGAGAAGLLAAAFAAESGARVVLVERTRDGGRKILISGGGRCNVLPGELDESRYVTASSRNTLRKMLRSWPHGDQRAFFEQRLGIPLVLEAETGKLFPRSNRAREVRDALVAYSRAQGAELRFGTRVVDVDRDRGGGWQVALESGERIGAAAVVLATGGLSVPATGSDGLGLRVAERLGHTVNPLYAALTPLTAEPARHAALAGISLAVRLEAPGEGGGRAAEGGFLFTHRGYSGPAVLDVSHVAVRARAAGRPQPLLVRWTSRDAAAWEAALVAARSGPVGGLLRRDLPDRLAASLAAEAGVDAERSVARLRREERSRLVEVLARYPLPWTGDEGYRKAEVTGGGVALGEVDPRTLESRVTPGLFLCGEMLDAFGPIGGYNFFWAWATGRAAGLGAAAHLREPKGGRGG